MARRLRIVLESLPASLGGAVLLCALAGCIGGAHPVPPALDPGGTGPDGGADLARGEVDDAGPAAPDVGPPSPPADESLAGFVEGDSSRTSVAPAAGVDWRWHVFAPAPWAIDAGVAPVDATGSSDGAADAR